MKTAIELSAPIPRGNGLIQTKFSIQRIEVKNGGLIIQTDQGNRVVLKRKPKYDRFLEDLKDEIKDQLEGSAEQEALDLEPSAATGIAINNPPPM